jgi:hypothetical protein
MMTAVMISTDTFMTTRTLTANISNSKARNQSTSDHQIHAGGSSLENRSDGENNTTTDDGNSTTKVVGKVT